MPADHLRLASKKALGDFGQLAALVNDYQNPGRAYRHTQGLMLAFLKELEDSILSGKVSQLGEDLTSFLRCQRLVVQYILSIPETIKRELSMQEEVHFQGAPNVGPMDAAQEPDDPNDWPSFE